MLKLNSNIAKDISIGNMSSCPIDDHNTMGVGGSNNLLYNCNLNIAQIINNLPIKIIYTNSNSGKV